MAPFSKPETVLKQAEGLVSVGQTHAALQSLTEMFTSKRFRSTPLTSLEPIMMRFVELCVDMRKGRTAKEGLMQYKNIAQNTSVQSIESVITRFVQLADAKVREAQEQAAVKSAVDVDDLEASETPESILLGAVSGDQSKDRTDRALVTPWLKFLWESYRTSLETLKNNARLEQIAQQAFKFCLKHQRKVEFRRLCETLRLHLSNVAKYSHQPHSINLSDADTLQHHLDTRFAQLNTSVELELWQEAFRSVEDVHNLLTMAKKAPRPAMMANYYEKLTKIFLMSGNALYHAAAWGRYYAIVTSIGGKSDEELSKLAGQVLVSALAVPVGLHNEEHDELKGKNARLTALLGLSKVPTRAGLLKDALSRDVLKLSPPPIKALYNILEVTFDPLTLCESIAPLLLSLSTTTDPDSPYAPYLTLLQRALLSRLLSQLAQVYSTITLSSLLSLVEPLRTAGVPGAYDDAQIEGYIMGCARRGELNIRVDHKAGSISFVDDAFEDAEAASTSEQGVQPTMAELVRTRLSKVATCLYTSIERLDREEKRAKGDDREEAEERQRQKFGALVAAAEGERKALQLRRALVARRRELLSELSVRKEKEETSRRAEISRREKEEETKRAREELKRKEQERTKKELETIRIDEAKKYAQSLVDKGILKPNDVDKLETIDTEGLIVIQVAQLEKEKKELSERLRIVAKRVDHIERAYRKEERPLLVKDYEHQQKTDRETHDAIQRTRLESARSAHAEDMATKARLARMQEDYSARRQVIVSRKAAEFAKKKEAAHQKIEEEKTKRRNAVLKEREQERQRVEKEEKLRRDRAEEEARAAAEREAEEERLRAEAEAAAEAAEATRREAEEKAAAMRKEREAERAAAAEKARLQLQREEEAEARLRARQAEKTVPLRAPQAARPVANGGEGNVWRRGTGTPIPARTAAVGTPPPRSESPAAPAAAPPRFAGAAGTGAGPSWREREAAKRAGGAAGTASPRPGAPATLAREEPKKDDDGFQPAKAVYRPPRRG
ncbi:hypothetical protein DXG01_005627 [Tephrocybe rancida]|nr:hypothetical protein DXG01_005627 [Tephrocybe rancida]